MSNLPQLLPAPRLLAYEQYQQHVRDIFCYILRHGYQGISVLYSKQQEDIRLQVGNWTGQVLNLLDTTDKHVLLAHTFLEHYSIPICKLLAAIKLPQAQLFLDENLRLCDLQVAVNKLAGPGMIQNLFQNIIDVPEMLKIENIDQRVLDAITTGNGDYTGDLIIKPSRFRYLELQPNRFTPLYVQVLR